MYFELHFVFNICLRFFNRSAKIPHIIKYDLTNMVQNNAFLELNLYLISLYVYVVQKMNFHILDCPFYNAYASEAKSRAFSIDATTVLSSKMAYKMWHQPVQQKCALGDGDVATTKWHAVMGLLFLMTTRQKTRVALFYWEFGVTVRYLQADGEMT